MIPKLRLVLGNAVAGAEDVELLMGSGLVEKRGVEKKGSSWRLKWTISFYGRMPEGCLGDDDASRETVSVGTVRQFGVNVSCRDPRALLDGLMQGAERTARDHFEALAAATLAARRAPVPPSSPPTSAPAFGSMPGEFGG